MSVDLGGPHVGVPEELLNRPEISSALEQVGCVRVTQRMRMQGPPVRQWVAGKHPPRVSGCHTVTSSIDEQGRYLRVDQRAPRISQIPCDGVARGPAEGDATDLHAFAEHGHRAATKIDRTHVEPAAFAHAQTCAVQELEDRHVPGDAGVVVGEVTGSVEQRHRILATRHPGQLFWPAGGVETSGDISVHDTVAAKKPHIRVH